MIDGEYKLLAITSEVNDEVYGIGYDPQKCISGADLLRYLEGIAASFSLKIIEVPDFKPDTLEEMND